MTVCTTHHVQQVILVKTLLASKLAFHPGRKSPHREPCLLPLRPRRATNPLPHAAETRAGATGWGSKDQLSQLLCHCLLHARAQRSLVSQLSWGAQAPPQPLGVALGRSGRETKGPMTYPAFQFWWLFKP